jgi:hypothetical protein
MKLATHGQKSSAARRQVGALSLLFTALALGSLAAAAGCNIVQGYQEAGDTLFPEQSTHLAAPGLRLVNGHYRGLGLVAGSEIYLLARAADDDATSTMFVMPYLKPDPCEIPEIGRFSVTQDPSRALPLFSYFSDDTRRGSLHFADARCRRYELGFEDARLPVAETERSLVIWDGTDLWLATPETGEKELLAEEVDQVVRGVFGRRYAVRSSGRLLLFDADWKPAGSFGSAVGNSLRVGDSLLFEDAAGVHRLAVDPADSSLVRDSLLVRDACSLGTQDGVWIALRSPCMGGKVMLLHEPDGETFTLPFDAEPTQLRVAPAQGSPGLDPLVDPFWFFYLRYEGEGLEDSLFVRTPLGEEHALGAHSTLLQLRLVESASEAYGYALVDIEGETGRYLWWNQSGETKTLAEGAMWRPDRLVIDFDGIVGKVAVASGDRLSVLAEGVPWQAFEYQDAKKQWTVLFHDMKDGIGRLSVFPRGLDQLEAAPASPPLVLPQLTEVAPDAVVFGTSAMNELLSGVLYLSSYDLVERTGQLDYRNLELRFTATVAHGVSDYMVLNDEVLYAVPYGDNAGIWLVQGK